MREVLERELFKGTGESPVPGKVYKWCPDCYFCSSLPFTITDDYKVEYLVISDAEIIMLCYHYEGIRKH